jgi:hypothetical protein
MPLTLAGAGAPCCCGSVFFLVAGGSAAAYGAKEYLLVQKIENTPTSKIRSVAVGLAEIKGRALPEEPLFSPISKAKCAYWRLTAEYYQSSKNGGYWVTFYKDSSGKPFYIEDETGKMLVEPSGADISIKTDFVSVGGMSDRAFFGLIPVVQLDRKVLDFLDANPSVKAQFQAHREIRVAEYFIAEGDDLYALGSAEPIEGASSDVPNENLILRRGKFDQTMFVSDSSEGYIVATRRIMALVSLFFGLGMLAVALIFILMSTSLLVL